MLHDVILAGFRFGCFMFVTSLHFLSLLISDKLQMFYSVFWHSCHAALGSKREKTATGLHLLPPAVFAL